mmetsp:Transcript_126947/g.395191  ORF Transcript_126947/g.395191 Transcript_126947/m.395191 type:complete len:391 (+) Transcript_126947:3-1175(+)
MTEGPKYKLWAERLQAMRARRLRSVHVQGCLPSAIFTWLGWCVSRILNVGKELFLVFEPVRQDDAQQTQRMQSRETDKRVLKIHFGHGGGYRVQPQSGGARAWGNGFQRAQLKHRRPAFELELSGECFAVWFALGGHCEIVTLRYLRTVESRACRDVNAEVFDFDGAVDLLARSGDLIVDAVMNQALLPGVGNVIKIEGLFESAVHPLRISNQLARVELLRLVRALRDFSIRWYHVPGQRCASIVRIYGKKYCCRCSGRTRKICEGTRQRITYYCPTCQPLFKRRWGTRQGASISATSCRPPPQVPVHSSRWASWEPEQDDTALLAEGEDSALLELVRQRYGFVFEDVEVSEAPSDSGSSQGEDAGSEKECHRGEAPDAKRAPAEKQTFY